MEQASYLLLSATHAMKYPLCFAIYYNRQAWSDLLKNCLAPILQQLKTESGYSGYTLYFCKEQGEHLRLELHLQSMDQQKIQLYQSTIEEFITAHPTQRLDKPLPIHDSFFLDLPNNSVYTNTFKPALPHTAHIAPPEVAFIRKEISALMLEAFAENPVDQDALFNFYLCLQIVALGVFGSPLSTVAEILREDHKKLAARLPKEEVRRLELEADKLIKNNFADLNELLALAEYGHYSADTEWLWAWEQACKQISRTTAPMSLFRDINRSICQHIDLHRGKWSALGLTIIKSLITNQNRLIHYTS
ncbi:lantibiotic dehydratase C-terminal domain-containing protein [Sphingobacterium pedocola]|uniref:Thiopeptide-type bacteriocin biosynthesis domain-containing protein n=1 Tax=Sphingobacterium pedocola TaxID=2082722 RepID=A0ABR9T8F0_9SPHI|nr:lantibiotic dehydratase C-terminal domain-containing protein [Sphingobacterium pedocola]MBE8721369.1 hypothetical protein [Sphingobacterium pedocola]